MSDPQYNPPAEDPELTAEEAEGIRHALEQIDRGETFSLEEVMDELDDELDALEQVRIRRVG